MSETYHVATQPIRSGVRGGIKFGERQGMLVDGDLTSEANAIAAVEADQATRHTAENNFAQRVIPSLEAADEFVPGFTSGGSIDAIDVITEEGDEHQTLHF